LGLFAHGCTDGFVRLTHARVLPELASDLNRIDAGRLPPSLFVLSLMGGAVVGAAERNRELITYLATKGARLHETQVMRV
jgi:hypothetical protein